MEIFRIREMREVSFSALGTPLARHKAGQLSVRSDTALGNLRASRTPDFRNDSSAQSADPTCVSRPLPHSTKYVTSVWADAIQIIVCAR